MHAICYHSMAIRGATKKYFESRQQTYLKHHYIHLSLSPTASGVDISVSSPGTYRYFCCETSLHFPKTSISEMSDPNKKQRQDVDNSVVISASNNGNPGNVFDLLGTDEIALIFSHLSIENIMCARVNRKLRDAAINTNVPNLDIIFNVNSVKKYNALAAMASALPLGLQQIEIGGLNENGQKYTDGEDPSEIGSSGNFFSHNIDVLSNFRRLYELRVSSWSLLNGRYPCLFNFPHLEKLHLMSCCLKWDLDMLKGLPSLKVLECTQGKVTGNIKSLSVLKDTLATLDLSNVRGVQGNLMDLSDFPHLTYLRLFGTAVKGDLREIGESDFVALEDLRLPRGIYGSCSRSFQRISDAPDLVAAVYDVLNHHPKLNMDYWQASLSRDSPDRYEGMGYRLQPPFDITLVKAGPRRGWRWFWRYYPCQVNWLDPEPILGNSAYEKYVEELEEINKGSDLYRWYSLLPPTEVEFRRMTMRVIR